MQTMFRFSRVNKADLPANAADGIPIITKDTDEIFIGAGSSSPLINLTSRARIKKEVVLTSNYSSILFDNLDSSQDKGYLIFGEVRNKATINSDYRIWANGDKTATNYSAILVSGNVANNSVFLSTVTKNGGKGFFNGILFAGYTTDLLLNITASKDSGNNTHKTILHKTVANTKLSSLEIESSVTNGLGTGSRLYLVSFN